MKPSKNYEALLELLVQRGAGQYGYEPVTQLAHALQCAYLAEQAHEPPSVIAAALLHDVGHLVDGADVSRIEQGEDDRHELRALDYLGYWFGASVIEPIRLHVEAKRYLCAVEPRYWADLSDASRASLEVQGGIYSQEEAAAFIARPYAHDAVRLRRYDDIGKDPQMKVPPPAHYLAILEQAGRLA